MKSRAHLSSLSCVLTVGVMAAVPAQAEDLNRDGDENDVVTMEIRVQNGKARLPR